LIDRNDSIILEFPPSERIAGIAEADGTWMRTVHGYTGLEGSKQGNDIPPFEWHEEM
jgi:hypothetical protein